LISRQDLFPWLAALYVDEAARGKGLAGKLQQHVIAFAAQAGYDELHLWSACRDFYERYGWQYIGDGLEYPNTRSISIVIRFALQQATQRSDGAPASG
jgi:GNAT superfamily N-acetyltransferase